MIMLNFWWAGCQKRKENANKKKDFGNTLQ